MQLWATPFVSDEYHARQPVGDTLFHRIGNADLVRGVSEALNISRQAREAEPSAAVYDDLATSAQRVLDGHYWLGQSEVGDLATPLHDIRKTAGLPRRQPCWSHDWLRFPPAGEPSMRASDGSDMTSNPVSRIVLSTRSGMAARTAAMSAAYAFQSPLLPLR